MDPLVEAAHPPWAWWQEADLLERYLSDLLQGELAALRPGRAPAARPAADDDLVDALGLDSLEWLALSAALGEVAPAALRGDRAPPRRWGAWLALVREGLMAGPHALAVRSSGSTGTPRRSTHPLPELWQEMQAMAGVIGPRRRVVCLVRSHHIYGFLFGVLLPHVWGGVPVLHLPGEQLARLPALVQPGDLIVGYPDGWAALGRLLPEWPANVVGVTSTAPCPAATAQAVIDHGLARLLQVYGSSETAGIGWRDQPDGPYRLHPFWRRDPSDPARLCRRSPDGTETVHRVPDALDFEDDRHLRPNGRLDGVVQVGGVNVQPAAVAEALRRHPGVAEAAVRPHALAGGGLRLKAYVVPRPGASPGLAQELMDWAARQLAPPARPVHVRVGPALPTGAMGKAADWPLD
jgi:4-coumarate--CoA ligase (photoactive yellow protein activation family)